MDVLPPPAVLVIPAAAVGLVMGSFVTALSYRQPRGQSISRGRSKCPACGHPLGVADLIPIASWLAQRGACRYCSAAISWRYPAIEFTTMVLFSAAVFSAADPLRLGLLAVMTVVMVALAVIDLEQRRLPNGLLLVLLALSLAWRWSGDREFLPAVVAAVAVFAIGVMLNAGFRALTGRTGLGTGDAKLLAVAAIAFPTGPLLLFLTAAGTLGVGFGVMWRWVAGARQFPFGPPALMAFWACLTAGEPVFSWMVSRLS